MTTEWVITTAAERIDLNVRNSGEITFTVTNPGTAQDRVVFEVVPGDGAATAWFPPVEEPQRLIPGGGSVSYLVKIAVPAATAAGEYMLQGRAYSADTAPEEGSRVSGRVAFTVRPTAAPKNPWWPYAVAAALLVAVLGVVGYLVLGGDGEPEVALPSTTPTTREPCVTGFVTRRAFPGDLVCVTVAVRDQTLADNALADRRRDPNGGAFGPDTCLQGFVWREASPSDHVCVLPETRTQTRADNARAESRRAP